MSERSLLERIGAAQNKLSTIASRHCALVSLHKEFDTVTRGKRFIPVNHVMWRWLIDARDMCLVHLIAWIDGVCSYSCYKYDRHNGGRYKRKKDSDPQGLLHRIQKHHLQEFTASRVASNLSDPRERYTATRHSECFRRLFPRASNLHPSHGDVERLILDILIKTKPLRDDRNKNRVHLFEQQEDSRPRGAWPKMQDLDQIGLVISSLQDMLNSMKFVLAGEWLTEDRCMCNPPCSTAAEEVVDAVILGWSCRRESLFGSPDLDEHGNPLSTLGEVRKAFYDALHARHEIELKSDPTVVFNEDDLVFDVTLIR